MIPTRPIGTLGLQLSGIVCVLFVCQLRDSQGLPGIPRESQGSSCRVLCVLFVYQFRDSQGLPGIPRDSWAPAVGYCVFFLCVNFGTPRDSQGFLGSSCRVLCVLFVCQFRDFQGLPGIAELQLSGILCSFCLSVSGLPGTPRDFWAPAVGYCVFFLFVNLFVLRDSQGFLGSSCRVLCVLFVCQFTCSQGFPGIPGLQLSGIVCSFCLSISGLPGTTRDS